jgi:hypothetical protein
MVYYTRNVIGTRGGKEPIPEIFQSGRCISMIDATEIDKVTFSMYSASEGNTTNETGKM